MTNTPIFDRILADRASEVRSSLAHRVFCALQSLPKEMRRDISNAAELGIRDIAEEYAETHSEGVLDLNDDGEFSAAIDELDALSEMGRGEIIDEISDLFLD